MTRPACMAALSKKTVLALAARLGGGGSGERGVCTAFDNAPRDCKAAKIKSAEHP
jgi:hypothetical protein